MLYLCVYLLQVWHSLSYEIAGFTFDAHFNRRTLYWTVPGTAGTADGRIFMSYVDVSPVTVIELTSTIGQVSSIAM